HPAEMRPPDADRHIAPRPAVAGQDQGDDHGNSGSRRPVSRALADLSRNHSARAAHAPDAASQRPARRRLVEAGLATAAVGSASLKPVTAIAAASAVPFGLTRGETNHA